MAALSLVRLLPLRSLSRERFDAARLIIARRVHLHRHRHELHGVNRIAACSRIATAKPACNAARVQHGPHAVMKLPDGAGSVRGEDRAARQPARPLAFTEARKCQRQAILPPSGLLPAEPVSDKQDCG